jgi:hypothetical protein
MSGVPFEDDVEDDPVVPWVVVVLMVEPIDDVPMDFDITSVRRVPYPDLRIAEIRPAVKIEATDVQNGQRLTVAGRKSRPIEVLAAPDVPKKPFVNVFGAIRHGSETRRGILSLSGARPDACNIANVPNGCKNVLRQLVSWNS